MSLKSDYLSIFGKTLSERYSARKKRLKKGIRPNIFNLVKNFQIKRNINDINEQIKEECQFNIKDIKKSMKLSNRSEKDNSNNKRTRNKENNIFKKLFQGNNYRYHKRNMEKMENLKKKRLLNKIEVQTKSTYFLPKYEYLYHKIITGPKWESISKRSSNIFNSQTHMTNLSYNDLNYFKDNIKGFVDMSKQTQRKGVSEIQDDKIKNEKLNNEKLNNEKLNNEESSLLLVFSKTSNESFNKCDNEEKYKHAPDFNRYMSREQLAQLFKNKKKKITNEEIFPNYHSIETKPKMMVFYNTNHNHKLKDNRNNYSYKNINFSPNKVFEKIYGNKLKVSPDFRKMISRQRSELPFFLNGITNRNICIVNTDKSLKMNNYTNSNMYNLREDLNKNMNKYKNEKLKEMRKFLSFENLNLYKKDRYLLELDNKIKKFNGFLSTTKEKNNFHFF